MRTARPAFPARPARTAWAALAIGAAAALVAGGCSDVKSWDAPPTVPVASAAPSPELTKAPAGLVVQLSGPVSSVAAVQGNAVALSGRTVSLVDLTGAIRSTTQLPADPTSRLAPLAATASGGGPLGVGIGASVATLAISADGSLERRSTAQPGGDGEKGTVTSMSSVSVSPDRNAFGFSDGRIIVIDGRGEQVSETDGLVATDGLIRTADSQGFTDGLVALDKHQSAIVELDGDQQLGLSLRVGNGASALTSGSNGRVFAVDARTGQLFVYTTAPLMMHQQAPIKGSPYAVGFDYKRDRVWVTLTATNELVSYDVSSGIPVEKARIATVRQPNSLAVDSARGVAIVGSATDPQLQIIDIAKAG